MIPDTADVILKSMEPFTNSRVWFGFFVHIASKSNLLIFETQKDKSNCLAKNVKISRSETTYWD